MHPDGALYVGDRVSFEVIAPQDAYLEESRLSLQVAGWPDLTPGLYPFEPRGLQGRLQATLRWVLDTHKLPPGEHTLFFSIQPDGTHWTEIITLLPAAQQPAAETEARWAETSSACCTVYYLTGTEAERDLPQLLKMIDEQAASAADKLGVESEQQIPLVLLPRLLGHGGFAADELAVSYLDRSYAGQNTELVLHHELVHWYDSRLGVNLRPSLLGEGLAVYLSGGHFKAEPLLPRAAALLDLGWYLPVGPLADNFYRSQHEIGYLQAGALVAYMVDRWGWQSFSEFYRDIHPTPGSGGQSQAIDLALQVHFDTSLEELEEGYLQALRAQSFTLQEQQDVQLTVQFYDTLRRYQQALDPSAYFLTTWLPDTREMRQENITADYLRHPQQAPNLALELALAEANSLLVRQNYDQARRMLEAINAALDTLAPGVLLTPAGEPPGGESPGGK